MAKKGVNLKSLFKEYEDEFLKFEDILPGRRLSERPDVHAFLLLDRVCPGHEDLVSAAGHDEIYFCVEPKEFALKATEEEVKDLIRCGLMYDEDEDALCMFV